MGISASNINPYGFNSNYAYSHYQAPFVNRSEITMGAFKVASADPLAPSSTSYGVNANPSTGGPAYTPSSAYLSQNAAVSSNVITTQNAIETGNQLQSATNQIAQQTPGSRFNTTQGVFTTNQAVQPATTVTPNINTFSNIQTQSPVMELTGRNAQISGQTAADFASVNANLNIQYSQQTNQALIALQNAATAAAMNRSANVTGRMDGMIPVSAATISDFSSTTPSAASHIKVFDNITETFNRLMDGGGHGGGGFMAQTEQEANDERKRQKTPYEFNKKLPRPDGLNFMA